MPRPSAIFCEFLGTLLLVAVVSSAAVANSLVGGEALTGESLANGLVVALIVTATLGVSGGQINPAVTLGLLSIGKVGKLEAVVFIAAQVAGAACGGLLIRQLVPGEIALKCLYGTPRLHDGLGLSQGILLEALATSLLCLSICTTVLHPKTPHDNGYGIGAAVALLTFTFAPLTGAAMNPARQLGSAMAAGYWADHWVYWVGPIAGAVLGLQLFRRIVK